MKNVRLRNDYEIFACNFDLCSTIFGNQHAISDLGHELN